MSETKQGVYPMLSYEDGIAAIGWLERVFGFREKPGTRIIMPDGSLGHVEMETEGGSFYLSTNLDGYESPKHHIEHCEQARIWSKSPWIINGIMIHVSDVDAHLERAKREGATILSGPESGFPGKRYRAEDLEGHRWMFMKPGS